jgi:predicted PurR-regulated permease PerM
MNHPIVKWQKHEQGLLILLVVLSLFSIFYVSSSFIFNILFATIMTLATYPFFLKIKEKFNLNDTKASLFATIGVGVILIAPISYVLSILGVETFKLYTKFQGTISEMDFSSKESTVDAILYNIKIPEDYISQIKPILIDHVDVANLVKNSKDVLLFISQNAIGSFLGTFAFFAISLFTMFFLYRDGAIITEKIKAISPLHDYYDSLLMKEISRLSGILTLSILTIAFIQGFSFSIVTMFMDLNWLFIGVAIALTSFIPVLGALIIWLPIGIYLILTGNSTQGLFILLWGAIVNGVIIDNILRPLIVGWICEIFDSEDIDSDLKKEEKKNFNPLNHTFIVTISTLGGIIKFDIIGLFIGPIIAGLAITVLEVYRIRLNTALEEDVESKSNKGFDIDSLLDKANEENVDQDMNEMEQMINKEFDDLELDITDFNIEADELNDYLDEFDKEEEDEFDKLEDEFDKLEYNLEDTEINNK